LGTKMGTKYYPAKLIQIPSKGNKWFVVITKPKELRAGSKNLQVRRSTGTSDKREAEILMPGIATDIYAEFDTALLQYDKAPKHPEITYSSPEDAAKLLRDDPLFMRRMLPPLEKPKNSKSLLSRTINDYLDYIETNQIGDIRERKTREKKCKEFLGLIGDIHLEDIKRIHAYQYADWMAEKGLANKTIRRDRIVGLVTG